LLSRYNLEIGAGLGDLAGKVWRVGLMGQSATGEHVTLFLSAIEDVLAEQGAAINTGAALPAARAVLG
jgi:alanine-glyoxylate transaminase/serine-glyoxylate transaminase/serine-pyruvate transaminase